MYNDPPTPALAKAGAAPGTTSGVELVFLSNNPKARSMVSSQRGPRQQAPQGHNNGAVHANRHPKATTMAS